MREQLGKLLTVKSLVTMTFTAVFSYLAVAGKVTGQEFLTIYTVIVSFYFGTQYERRQGSEGK